MVYNKVASYCYFIIYCLVASNYRDWQKKDPFAEIIIAFFWLFKIIPNFANTYWDIPMWIILNQYRSICRPPTSITRRSLGLNAPLCLLVISCGTVFHFSTMASFKESRSVIPRSPHTFCSRSPQISKSTGFLIWNVQWSVMGL